MVGSDHDLAQVENEYARVSSLLPPREPRAGIETVRLGCRWLCSLSLHAASRPL